MMRKNICFILMMFGAISMNASAQEIYRWVDKEGKLHFTDTPPPPAESKNITSKEYKTGAVSDDVPYSVQEAMKRNPVTLYANDCGEVCTNARALLSKRGIPYADKNPQADASAADALKALSGGLTVPYLLVGTTGLPGFEEGQWQAILDAAGYPRTNPGLKPKAKPVTAATDKDAASSVAPAAP